MPAVRVILPTFDSPKTLRHAVDSVLNQTFSDLELALIVDGGSTATHKVVDQLAAKDARVRPLRFPKGLELGHEWRDLAIRESDTELIAYIDDDDLWLPNHLATLVPLIKSGDFDVACSAVVSVTPANRTELVITDHASGKIRFSLNEFRDIFDTHFIHTKEAYLGLPQTVPNSTHVPGSPHKMFVGFGLNPKVSWVHSPLPTALSFHGVSMRAAGKSQRSRGKQIGTWLRNVLAGRVDSVYLFEHASVISHLWLLYTHFPVAPFSDPWTYLASLTSGSTLPPESILAPTWQWLTGPQEHMVEVTFHLYKAISENRRNPILTTDEMHQVVISLTDIVRSDRPIIDFPTARFFRSNPWVIE